MAEICPVLPDDVFISEILVRLPANSIGRFRCVSKPWNSLLSSPEFVKSHFIAHIHDSSPEKLLIRMDEHCTDYAYISTLATGCRSTNTGGYVYFTKGVSRKVTIPLTVPHDQNRVYVEGSCHGLVLINQCIHLNHGYQDDRFLMNPLTLKVERVENFWSGKKVTLGLGYDSLSDDFKIVQLSFDAAHNSFSDIYSVKTRIWKRGACHGRHLGNLWLRSGIFTDGCIHWLDYKHGNVVIAAFSLAREEFETIHPPQEFDERGFSTITIIGGCLAILDSNQSSYGSFGTEVWVMKEYGVQDSWMKFTVSCRFTDPKWKFEWKSDRYLEDRFLQDVVMTDMDNGFPKWEWTCTRSLVSPNHNGV